MDARIRTTIPRGSANNNCYLCNGAQRTRNGVPERIVDTGVHIDHEGFLAICETCATYIGRLLGLLTPDDVKGLAAELTDANDARVVAAQRVADLERQVEALRVIAGERLADVGLTAEAPLPDDPVEAMYEAYKRVNVVDEAEEAIDRERAEAEADEGFGGATTETVGLP